jgi:hypothetical protein
MLEGSGLGTDTIRIPDPYIVKSTHRPGSGPRITTRGCPPQVRTILFYLADLKLNFL